MKSLGGSSASPSKDRADLEAVARRFQERTLSATIEARLSLKRGEGGTDSYARSKAELVEIRDEIEGDTDITVSIKYDLLADSWTKTGRLLYQEAFSEPPVAKQEALGQAGADVTGKICTKWNERESTWRKSGTCQSRGTSQSRS